METKRVASRPKGNARHTENRLKRKKNDTIPIQAKQKRRRRNKKKPQHFHLRIA